jgi:DNA-binding transcriptional LysR family regulator
MYPNLNDLHYFVEMAATKNISQASIRLGVTQPTLSAALTRLERILNTKLFHRSKKGVDLTPDGREFLGHSKNLIQEWESIKYLSSPNGEEIKGRLILGCHISVALYSLPDVFAQWTRNYPALEIKLVHDLSRKILDQVVSNQVDIGIIVNPKSHPDLIIKNVCKDEVTFFSNPSIKTSETTFIGDENLMQTQDLLRKLKKINKKVERFIATSSLEMTAALTVSGAGIGILPTRVAMSHVELKKIKNAPVYKDDIAIVYRSELRKLNSLKVISDDLEIKLRN